MIGWLSFAGVAALHAGVVWPVMYELGDEALVIRFGLVRSRIRYDRIRGVRPSRSVLASPALSIDRLAIDLGAPIPTTISPADRDAFLADLAARARTFAAPATRSSVAPPSFSVVASRLGICLRGGTVSGRCAAATPISRSPRPCRRRICRLVLAEELRLRVAELRLE